MFAYIIGSQNPVVGKAYAYEISSGSLSIFGENTKYEWYLFKKQKNGSWRDITGTPKLGRSVTYTFHEPVLANEFELRVFETKSGSITGTGSAKKQIAKLDIVPSQSKTAQIDKVVLLKRGSKDVNKANYRDTLFAQAFCTAMFDQEVEFQLWEDDASGGGHNAVINKNNHHTRTYKARVNEKGIAEVKIPLSGDERILRQIANKYLMKGDKSEGKNHEFYITASYHGKIQKASQVNVDVANPDYKKDSQKSQPKVSARKPEQKKKTPQPQKPQPRQDTYKKPLPNNKPSTGKNKQSDKDGRIIDVSFKNRAGKNFTTTPKFGETIIVEILTKNVIGKHYNLRVWEDDTIGEHDLLYEGIHKITNDKQLVTFALTKDRQQIGEIGNDPRDTDSGEYRAEWTDHQELFAEIAFADISKESTRLTVEILEEYKSPEYKKSAAVVRNLPKGKTANCGGKFCIDKKSPSSELIREINIRLAGFGGNVPTDKFTDRTEKMIKQFQRDYMKVPETGKVCGNVLKAIDEFQNKYSIDFTELKCKCKKCTGFGDGSNKGKYLKGNLEAHHKYEYPGIHRSLLSSIRSVKFYLAKDGRYSFNKVNSGYRCRFHDEYLKKPTTNHMGKALDLHFNDKTGRTKKTSDMEIIRKDIFNKYLGAKWDWKSGQTNIFNLESTGIGATTWVHYDVREFDEIYLKDIFFAKSLNALNEKNIVTLALELGFTNTCSCMGGGTSSGKLAPVNNVVSKRVDPKTLKASDKLIEFIKDWEKLYNKAYNDSKDYCTIGYGHLIKKKKCEDITIPDEFKNGITEAEATKLFKEDLKVFEKAVQRDVTVKLYQREFDALVDILFNCGAYFLSSGKAPKLYKNLLDEKYEDAAKEFLDIENKKRREQNYQIFINGNYDS
ncbi:MAG: hypothetical protein EOO44_13680, partial [Flavobacterium sp.]